MTAGAFSLATLLRGCLSIGAGKLGDRFGPRITTTACGFFLGLGYVLMSQVTAIWQLYLFYGVILAVGMSASFVPLLSTVARWFVKRRGVMTGFVLTGVGTGIMVMPPIARWLIANYDWRTSYIIIGIAALLVIMLAGQFLRGEPAQMGQLPYDGHEVTGDVGRKLGAGGISLRQAIHTTNLWLLCAMYFCFLFTTSTVMVHIDPHATELGLSFTGAANILAAIGGISILGRVALGAAADRIGNKSAIIIGFALLAASLIFILFVKQVWMLYPFTVIYGLAQGALFVLFSPMVAELFGLSSHGVIFGVITFVGSVGGAIGSALAGHIFDVTSSYQIAFFICAVIASMGLILSFLVRPTGAENERARRLRYT